MKKGDVNVINILIIAVITGIFLVIFARQLAVQFESSGKLGICEASIIKAHLIQQVAGGVASGATDLFTQRLNTISCNDLPDTEIKKNDVLKSGKIQDDAVKKQLADAMLECWKTVGRGKLDPYKKYDGDQAYCLVCSDINFNDDFVKEAKDENYQIKDMLYWLASHNVPGLQSSYFQELYGTQPDTQTITQLQNTQLPFDLTQQHSVIWREEANKKDLLTTVGGIASATIAGAAAGCIGGGAVGAQVGSAGGALAGGIWNLGLGAVPGATAGGLAGAITGCIGGGTAAGGVGFVGSYWISENVFEDKTGTKAVYNGIALIPKSVLGEDLIIPGTKDQYKKPFCTKLVNR